MGTTNKEKVQLVISHLEGCSGNFLGRLFADNHMPDQTLFRVDTNHHTDVLAINGYKNWADEITRLDRHRVVVTHNFNLQEIQTTFPQARIVQIYPYTHVGNVLYNVCFKKLNIKIPNIIDNHLLHIQEWYWHIQQRYPAVKCTDFWTLTDASQVEQLLSIKFTDSQQTFFKQYWQQQLMYPLNIPSEPKTVEQLITDWTIADVFDDWLVAWTIFVYELINNKQESNRLWSIDTEKFNTWTDVERIQDRYLTTPTQ